ncbi:hypothetical protein M378DRAFT_173249 [Amanita muscaria Koide BX008]|uniref:Uncharacterized protein n=1 Tax=Amanita muscaria (strain Koide BX008) TaxID=946122 RepID=A0A0C2W3Z8_AMAMK|nr:hypothetical protein M378DRAFT_173249 [Amanita muscaria Koide BX008]
MPSLALYINCSNAFPTSCPTVFRCAFACASLPIFSPTKMSEDWDELERTYVTPPFHSFGTKPHCFSGSAFAPSALKVTLQAKSRSSRFSTLVAYNNHRLCLFSHHDRAAVSKNVTRRKKRAIQRLKSGLKAGCARMAQARRSMSSLRFGLCTVILGVASKRC